MKSIKSLLIALFIYLALSTTSALAVDPYIYVGAKYGIAFFDEADFDDGNIYASFLGYQINEHFSLEAEVGKFQDGDEDLDGLYLGTYGIAMFYNELMYIRAKIGLLYEDIDVKTSFGTLDDSDLGLSYGVGFGFFMKRSSVDIEIAIIDEELYTLTAGLTFEF